MGLLRQHAKDIYGDCGVSDEGVARMVRAIRGKAAVSAAVHLAAVDLLQEALRTARVVLTTNASVRDVEEGMSDDMELVMRRRRAGDWPLHSSKRAQDARRPCLIRRGYVRDNPLIRPIGDTT